MLTRLLAIAGAAIAEATAGPLLVAGAGLVGAIVLGWLTFGGPSATEIRAKHRAAVAEEAAKRSRGEARALEAALQRAAEAERAAAGARDAAQRAETQRREAWEALQRKEAAARRQRVRCFDTATVDTINRLRGLK